MRSFPLLLWTRVDIFWIHLINCLLIVRKNTSRVRYWNSIYRTTCPLNELNQKFPAKPKLKELRESVENVLESVSQCCCQIFGRKSRESSHCIGTFRSVSIVGSSKDIHDTNSWEGASITGWHSTISTKPTTTVQKRQCPTKDDRHSSRRRVNLGTTCAARTGSRAKAHQARRSCPCSTIKSTRLSTSSVSNFLTLFTWCPYKDIHFWP